MRADVRPDDIPMLLDGVGLTREAGPEARWERHLAIVIDGLRAAGQRVDAPPQADVPRATSTRSCASCPARRSAAQQ